MVFWHKKTILWHQTCIIYACKGGVSLKNIQVTVQSETGLHARPASQFVSEASKYLSDIKIEKNNKTVNGKSIMNVLSLCVNNGDQITIIADGEDEDIAIQGVLALFEKGL